MASSKERQRKLARAKLDRQMARRAAAARRKRQIRAGIGAGLAVLLVALGTIWLFGGFDSDPEKPAAQDQCTWTPQDAASNPNLVNVGTPPTKGLMDSGDRTMTVVTEGGDITVQLDAAASTCGTASMAYLASKNFFDNTQCHELTGTFLRCGDKSGTGTGGPAYSFFGENVPSAPEATASASPSPGASPSAGASGTQYPRGTVALVATTPGNYGSQFVIFHKDLTTTDPTYSIIGKVIGGLPVLDKIVKAGTVDNGSGAKVKPAKNVVLKDVFVDDETGFGSPTPGAGSPGASSPAASPTAKS